MSAQEHPSDVPLSVGVERRSPSEAVVRPVGDVDSATVELVDTAVDGVVADGVRHVVLDLAGVAFMGSAGLAMLLDQRDAAAARGGRLALAAVPRAVVRPLTLTGLLDHFEVHDDVDGALAAR